MPSDLPKQASCCERVTGIEPAFSAWEIDRAQFADLGRWIYGQVRPVFLVPARPPRSAEIPSVVARMWHERRPKSSQLAAEYAVNRCYGTGHH